MSQSAPLHKYGRCTPKVQHMKGVSMYRFKFFVHCKGWAAGGYENCHFAETKAQARRIVQRWNEEYQQRGVGARVTLLSIEKISDDEFAADYIY